jgi:hypothetical protein
VPLTILVPNAIWLWPHRGRTFVEHPNRFEPGGLLGALLDLTVPLVLVWAGLRYLARREVLALAWGRTPPG